MTNKMTHMTNKIKITITTEDYFIKEAKKNTKTSASVIVPKKWEHKEVCVAPILNPNDAKIFKKEDYYEITFETKEIHHKIIGGRTQPIKLNMPNKWVGEKVIVFKAPTY